MDITSLRMVKAFHEAFDINNGESPEVPTQDADDVLQMAEWAICLKACSIKLEEAARKSKNPTALLRLHLIVEETSELAEAMAHKDIESCLDAVVDLRYVLDGTTLALGLQGVFGEAFAEVHRSNMSKLEDGVAVKNEAGRVVKGKNYSPPDLGRILRSSQRDIIHLQPTGGSDD